MFIGKGLKFGVLLWRTGRMMHFRISKQILEVVKGKATRWSQNGHLDISASK